MAGYGFFSGQRWSIVKNIATTDGDTTLLAAPGAGRRIVVQALVITITTSAAQAFDIEDQSSTPLEYFKAPASLAAGTYVVDCGPLGLATTDTNVALEMDVAAAGVGATISGFGYYNESS